jgi:hypothetical protein
MTTYQPGGEPPEEDLAPKPPIADMPDENELVEGTQEVPESDFLSREAAGADDTVDDAETP